MTAKETKPPTEKTKTAKSKAASAGKSKSQAASSPKTKITRQDAKQPKKQQAPAQDAKGRIRAWYLRLGILLAAGAFMVVAYGKTSTVELTTQYLSKDELAVEVSRSGVSGVDVFAEATRHLVDLRLSWVVAAFMLIFAAAYILTATVWRKHYDRWLDRGVNGLRWATLGVGGGAIMTVVAMLSGVSDWIVLAMVFGLVVLAGVFATAVEFIGNGRRLRRLLALGAVAAIVLPWLVMAVNVKGLILYNGAIPSYLYYVYVSVTLLLAAVALGLYFRTRQRGRWANTLYTEKTFLGLGFAAPALVALQIFAGALL